MSEDRSDYSWEDEAEVAAAKDKLDPSYRRYLTDLHMVASTPAGERVICDWLEMLGTFMPAWTEKNAKLAKNTVLKDFGQSILDDLSIIADDTHDKIQKNIRARRKLAEVLKVGEY